jgi:hypothetical protein
MALHIDAHRQGKVECLFVRHAQLFGELVQADVFRHRVIQPFIGLICLSVAFGNELW